MADAAAVDVTVLSRLREDIGGDDATMRELVEAFLHQSPELLADARRGAAGDAKLLLRAAHTLKSTAATFGATRLAALCRALEHDAMAGSVPDAARRVEEVEREFARAKDEILSWKA